VIASAVIASAVISTVQLLLATNDGAVALRTLDHGTSAAGPATIVVALHAPRQCSLQIGWQ
jgi:hypothetical protein